MRKQNASAAVISAVLDSSAVLAVLLEEPGAELVVPFMGNALISTVNLAEVITKLVAGGGELEAVRQDVEELALTVTDFTRALAEDAGTLVVSTSEYGLSLGDRACLALARRDKLPVLTADRAWRDVEVGVRIELIR